MLETLTLMSLSNKNASVDECVERNREKKVSVHISCIKWKRPLGYWVRMNRISVLLRVATLYHCQVRNLQQSPIRTRRTVLWPWTRYSRYFFMLRIILHHTHSPRVDITFQLRFAHRHRN